MVKMLMAWALLFLFSTLYTLTVYKVVSERKRMDLMWIPAVAFVVPLVLFLVTKSPLSILATPLLQSVGMVVIQRMLSQD